MENNSPPVSRNVSAFKQLAQRAVDHNAYTLEPQHSTHHGHSPTPSPMNIHKRTVSIKHIHNRSLSSGNVTHQHSDANSFGSQDDISSGEGSDAETHRGVEKRKGLIYQKTENIITRIRDLIAQSDVFTARRENPPFVACLLLSVWFIPIFLIILLWDTLAVTTFEIPHLSLIDHPGFMLGWHFVMVTLAMYGFMLSYLSSGNSPRTSLAAISLAIHFLLLFYRIFMEVYFDGFRGQEKLYIEMTSDKHKDSMLNNTSLYSSKVKH